MLEAAGEDKTAVFAGGEEAAVFTAGGEEAAVFEAGGEEAAVPRELVTSGQPREPFALARPPHCSGFSWRA